MFCRGPTPDNSGGNRFFWTLEGEQVGSLPGTLGEIIVGCTLEGGMHTGVRGTLGDSIGS
jgi:hypothetical protein